MLRGLGAMVLVGLLGLGLGGAQASTSGVKQLLGIQSGSTGAYTVYTHEFKTTKPFLVVVDYMDHSLPAVSVTEPNRIALTLYEEGRLDHPWFLGYLGVQAAPRYSILTHRQLPRAVRCGKGCYFEVAGHQSDFALVVYPDQS